MSRLWRRERQRDSVSRGLVSCGRARMASLLASGTCVLQRLLVVDTFDRGDDLVQRWVVAFRRIDIDARAAQAQRLGRYLLNRTAAFDDLLGISCM